MRRSCSRRSCWAHSTLTVSKRIHSPRHLLGDLRVVRADHAGDLGIAAGGLAIRQHDDGLARIGNLHRPEGNAVREDVAVAHVLDPLPLQAIAHAAGLAEHLIRGCEEGLNPGGREAVRLRAEHHAQN